MDIQFTKVLWQINKKRRTAVLPERQELRIRVLYPGNRN